MADFSPLSRQPSLAAQVTSQMLASILSGSSIVGAELPSERDLSLQFGVSRTVIREALRGLQAKGVLEVRTHDTPFLLEHGQIVARLVYEPLTERPTRLYGEGGSHYQSQGLKLSKHFRVW